MAENVALPANTGTVATDERTINAVTVHVQRVGEIGGTAFANGQVTVDTTAGGVTVCAARDTRKTVLIRNLSTTINIYVGTGTVSSSNGMLVKAGEAIVIGTTAAVKAIAASSSVSAAYIEEYDS